MLFLETANINKHEKQCNGKMSVLKRVIKKKQYEIFVGITIKLIISTLVRTSSLRYY